MPDSTELLQESPAKSPDPDHTETDAVRSVEVKSKKTHRLDESDDAAILARLPDPNLTENAITVLNRRYLQKDPNGQIIETPKRMFWRVAKTIAANEQRYTPDMSYISLAEEFYTAMAELDFIPNSPTLMNAGRRLGQLAACFVLPVEDSMEGIFTAVKNAALVHKSGGGTGFSFSRLRPKASVVASTAGTASGPVSFMSVFNSATETIKQGGTRRGANMGILRVDHPDILDFINCKRDMVSITNFNISVAVTDRFMGAVEEGGNYNLRAPHTGEVVRQENAREIFNLIAENAWHNGDPGVVFIDEINRRNPTPHIGMIEATNPCGEQPLLPYEACNLGSLNLNNMVTSDGNVDWDHLRSTIRLAVRFLDNIIDLNKYPVEEIRKTTQANRKIGLGLMGFADMLYGLGIPYNSEEALDLGKRIQKFIHDEARSMSDELAEERGSFPNYEGSIFKKPTRNATVTTIAPTGTISMIADTSGGIEPNFALAYVKRVMDDDRLLYINKRFEKAAREMKFYSDELMEHIASGQQLKDEQDVPEEIRSVFVSAHDISPEWHIRMQAAFQENCENAVSKTINFPHSATIDDVKNSYRLAWKSKCKGITIYRDGSRNVQVMNVGNGLAKGTSHDERARAAGEPITTTQPRIPYRKPRNRPVIMHGYTEQIKTGEGTLYITINEDEYGPFEVFASLGKQGGSAAAQSEAIGRLVSLALRTGVDPYELVRQLKGITGPNPVWYEGVLIRSTPDAIARTLERYLKKKGSSQEEFPFADNAQLSGEIQIGGNGSPKAKIPVYLNGEVTRELCPDCNTPVVFEEGCMRCRDCGYSKCE